MDINLRRPVPIAIVGMASHFPDSRSLFDFWNNIRDKKDSITDNLGWEGYWRKEAFYDPDTTNKEKTYAYKGGWIPPIDFDPVEFKLPPNMLDSISTAQLFSLYVAKKAFVDAGIVGNENSRVDREKIGVILGGAGNGNTSFSLAARQQAPYLKEIMRNAGLPDYVVEDIVDRLLDQYLEWNEDSFPGFLGNVACGRISSYFDLGGTSNMVDAACASSLAAIKAAVGELAEGSCDAVLTGGVNLENSIFSFLCFSRTPALSPSNTSRPFDQKSDGMMLGDGVGFLVLKRLDDAVRDGDRIYAVMKSISGSSDGRAKSIFAPRMEGQIRALNRAYDAAGITPQAIGMIEAHGTGTVSGDQTEISSLKAVYSDYDLEEASIAVGSVKSQIGHTRCAAGAASMIKVALGLHHKVLPPTINVEEPSKSLKDEGSPFYVSSHARPWIKSESDGPRTAALSAFGFGGTNYHVVMEEYQTEQQDKYRLSRTAEVVLFHADTPAGLLESCEGALEAFKSDDGLARLYEHLDQQESDKVSSEKARIAFAANGLEDVVNLLETAVKQLSGNLEESWDHPLGIFYRPSANESGADDVVALFPGQGSQYPNMAISMANEFPEMRQAVADFDQARIASGDSKLSKVIFPPSSYSVEEQLQQSDALRSTDNAQPGIGAISLGYWDLLAKSGLKSRFAAGHSYGELVALYTAGVFDRESLQKLSIARGKAMKMLPADDQDAGSMLAVALSEQELQDKISAYDDVFIANYNASNQIVLGGGSDSIQALHDKLKAEGHRCAMLPVAAAFHTKFVEHALQPFKDALQSVKFHKPKSKVYSNVTGEAYPDKPEKIRELLASQLISPVRFSTMIEKIYQAGGRRFIEIGPKGVLGKLVSEILADKPHSVVSVDSGEKSDDSLQFRRAQAKMLVEGLSLKDLDPYRVREPIPEPKGILTYEMNGGFFLSDNGFERRQRGMRKDTTLVDQFVKERQAAMEPEITPLIPQVELAVNEPHQPSPNYEHNMISENDIMEISNKPKQPANPDSSALNTQIQAQNGINMIHQQFQDNQKEYIQFLNKLMQQQFQLFDKHNQASNFKDMLGSLNESFRLLDHNQSHYHTNHERYFLNQYALMGGQGDSNGMALEAFAGPAVAAPVSAPAVSQPAAATAPATPASAPQEISSPQTSLPEVPGTPSVPAQVADTAVVVAEKTESEFSEKDQEVLRQLKEVTAEGLVDELVKIISEKTGYPADMVGADMDLEADLGIDSIKRIEIIGAMFEALSDNGEMEMEYDAEDYSDMETIDVDQFSSINKMVEFMMGYVNDIIEHLESGKSLQDLANAARDAADDGSNIIDVEPVGRESDEQPSEVDGGVASAMNTIGFVTSTSDLEEASASPKLEPANSSNTIEDAGVKAKVDAKDSMVAASDSSKAASGSLPINRFRAEKKVLGMPDQRKLELADGHVLLVVADSSVLGAPLAVALAEQGYKIALVGIKDKPEALKSPAINTYQFAKTDESGLTDVLDDVRQTEGPIGGLLFVQSDSPDYKSVKTSFSKKDYTLALVQFLLAKLLTGDLNSAAEKGDAVFMLVSQLDGELGTAGNNGYSLINAGVTGLAKSLHHEWNQVFCRALDIKPKMAAKDAVGLIVEELHDPRTNLVEVGRKSQSERCTLTLVEEAVIASDEAVFNPKDTVLVTGGARGITAECIIKLATRNPANYVLLGRTDIEQPVPAWAEGIHDEKALRAAAIGHMRDAGEQVTPMKVESLLKSVMHITEVQATLSRLDQLGAKSYYLSVDVLDKKDLGKQLDAIQDKVGPVTAIVHGAGNLADKKMEKKTADDFKSVFSTKVNGLDNLFHVLDEKQLKQIVVFSSVSGFFGNAGQTDYSMANEVLNKFAYMYRSFHPKALVKSINWGPWDSGMVNDTLKKAYLERGIAIIDVDEGADFFANEFFNQADVQMVVGSEIYQTPKQVKELGSRTFSRHISVKESPFLNDHEIDGSPVLPATCAINWMVEAAECALPGYRAAVISDFKVLKGLVFDTDESLHFNVEVTPSSSEAADRPKAKVLSVAVFSDNNGSRLNHYNCSLVMDLEAAVIKQRLPIPAEQNVPDLQWSLYGESELPRLLFHGASFQGIQKILSLTDDQIAVKCHLSSDKVQQGQFSINSFNPYVADVSVQAPYIWLPIMSEFAGLPSSMNRIEQFGDLPLDQDFYVIADITKQSSNALVATVRIMNELGDLLCEIEGLGLSISKNLKRKLIEHAEEQAEEN